MGTANSVKSATDVTKMVLAGMQQNPGKKGGQGNSKKRLKTPIVARSKRNYQHVTNINPFSIKKMTRRISLCQGCSDSLLIDGEKPAPPYDYCVARIEKRTFSNVVTGKKRLASPGWRTLSLEKELFTQHLSPLIFKDRWRHTIRSLSRRIYKNIWTLL